MMTVEEAIKKGILSKERIEAEKAWLRSIDMNDDKDVGRAALEIIISQMRLV